MSQFKIPKPLQKTLNNLAYLGGIEPNSKLFIKEKSYIKTDCYSLARFMRCYYYGESLNTEIKAISDIIEDSLDMIQTYHNNTHFDRLIEQFKRAYEGLINLKNTYASEGSDFSMLEDQIYVMKKQLDSLEMKIEGSSKKKQREEKLMSLQS